MDLREIHDWIVKPQLRQVSGVVEVNAIGGEEKQFHVLPDPARLLQYGLTLEQLREALLRNNADRGAGYIERAGEQLLVRSPGQLRSRADIERVVVDFHDGAPVRVADVAQVRLGAALRTGAATERGAEVVLGTALMLIGANPREVAQGIAARLRTVQKSLPRGVTVRPVYDRTVLVERTTRTVSINLTEGALLVIAVLFGLLGNLRAAVITALVIPLSLLLAAMGMWRTGTSANLMSLGALDFGLIVDGAVIIVENCLRRLGSAQRTRGRALTYDERCGIVASAAAEVIRPAMFGVFIITVVYVPLLTLTGVEGKLFRPMALTVVFALAAA
ncbi:MAG: efflux RND transporter permease subunit, partial [Gammaproteobacteria bacterium]|nr:efflux RND transporter permease subunit [Gammaproteobacteria bacterium]